MYEIRQAVAIVRHSPVAVLHPRRHAAANADAVHCLHGSSAEACERRSDGGAQEIDRRGATKRSRAVRCAVVPRRVSPITRASLLWHHTALQQCRLSTHLRVFTAQEVRRVSSHRAVYARGAGCRVVVHLADQHTDEEIHHANSRPPPHHAALVTRWFGARTP